MERIETQGDCWIWKGPMHQSGVPMVRNSKFSMSARKLSRILFAEPHVSGSVSTCGDNRCVRPEHLIEQKHPDVWFWPKVEKTDSCWLWRGEITKDGYGRTGAKKDGSTRGAHRIAWELTNGPIPDGLFVLHKCDNPPCVRPEHLFLGTQADNRRDCVAKGRQPRGSAARKSSLTEEDVVEIRQRHESGETATSLGACFGVTRANIGYIVKRKTWTHVP